MTFLVGFVCGILTVAIVAAVAVVWSIDRGIREMEL